VATAAFRGRAVLGVRTLQAPRSSAHGWSRPTGAQSVAFIPLLLDERVTAVLVAGSVYRRRAFTAEELGELQTLAAERGARTRPCALDGRARRGPRARALRRANLRDGSRSELNIDELLRVAVEETGLAIGVDRCLIRLGPRARFRRRLWHRPGLAPVSMERPPRGLELAVRRRETVRRRESRNSVRARYVSLGGRDPILSLGYACCSRRPIVIFDELIGVLSLHRNTPGPWDDREIALTEAVAREIGLAVRVAQLLRENELRITQHGVLFRIAGLLGQSLSLSDTLESLAQAANETLGGSFTAVLMPSSGRLELARARDCRPHSSRRSRTGSPSRQAVFRARPPSVARSRRPMSHATTGSSAPGPRRRRTAGYRALLAVACDEPPRGAFRPRRGLLRARARFQRRRSRAGTVTSGRRLAARLNWSELFEAERTARALSQQLAAHGRCARDRARPGCRPRGGRAAGARPARRRLPAPSAHSRTRSSS